MELSKWKSPGINGTVSSAGPRVLSLGKTEEAPPGGAGGGGGAQEEGGEEAVLILRFSHSLVRAGSVEQGRQGGAAGQDQNVPRRSREEEEDRDTFSSILTHFLNLPLSEM